MKGQNRENLAFEMKNLLQVLSCFFARTTEFAEELPENLSDSEKFLMKFIHQKANQVCKIFKQLWRFSLKDPNAFLEKFLGILVNWGNNRIFAERYFHVCQEVIGQIFQEFTR